MTSTSRIALVRGGRVLGLSSLFLVLACSETDPEENAGVSDPYGVASGGSLSTGGSTGAGGNSSGTGATNAGTGATGQTSSGGAAMTGAGGEPSDSGGSSSGTGSSPGAGGAPAATPSGTFRVMGRHLHDRCGEQVVLRGVNEMIVWSPGLDGDPEYSEIAKTGANVVRIVWNEEGSATQLDTAITNALAQKLIPMIEHHSATGELDKVTAVVDYWTQDEVLSVIKKHESQLLLNIANEAGDDQVQAADFQAAYETHITRLRAAGLKLPLIIDAPSWGQNIDVLQATWQALTAHDPEHNMMYSVHMWWDDADGSRVTSEINESLSAEMPLIVGEFAQHSVWQCSQNPFSYTTLLDLAQENSIGWLAWSWGGIDNGDCADDGSFDMTVDGVFGDWEEPWGGDVAVTHPNSIQNTSVRPHSITEGNCQ